MALFEVPHVPTMLAGAALAAGEAARRNGDLARASVHLSRALRLSKELGQRGVFPELLQEIAGASTCRAADAVRLLGASERLQLELGVPRWDSADHEQTAATLRAELGDAAFETACVAGRALSEEEALSLAARCLD